MSKPRLRITRYLLPLCLIVLFLVVLFICSLFVTENNSRPLNAIINYANFKGVLNEISKSFDNDVEIVATTIHNASKINISLAEKITYQMPANHQRVWFLPNGTVKPDPVSAQRLALWPDEGDPNDDRIINQLMYMPLDYDPKRTRAKKIYLRTDDSDWREISFNKCAVSSCELVNQTEAANADLIFFKDSFVGLPFNRPFGQLWLLFVLESVRNTQSQFTDLPRNTINWTATYRHDSDIPTPYAKFVPYSSPQQTTRINRNSFNYAANKTKMVAWFVSNCAAKNNRLEYAHKLKRYVQVDIYGMCGTLRCSRYSGDQCVKMLDRDYKFYLSFENSNCKDYITEKFWYTALNHNIVPIVMGAQISTYKRFAPSNSFIHVDDFASPKQLARYLKYLDRNDVEYNKYFAWKGSGQVMNVLMWCRVCALLHAPPKPRVYNNFDEWWSGSSDICVDNKWNIMNNSSKL